MVWNICKGVELPITKQQVMESLTEQAETFSADQWLGFSANEVGFICGCFKKCNKSLPSIYYLKNTHLGTNVQEWINPTSINAVSVTFMKKSDAAFEWFYEKYKGYPIAFATIAPQLQAELVTLIEEKGKDPFPSAQTVLSTLHVESAQQDQIYDIPLYFRTYPDMWKELSPEKRSEYLSRFLHFGYEIPSLTNAQISLDALNYEQGKIPVGYRCQSRVQSTLTIAQTYANSGHEKVNLINEDLHTFFNTFRLELELITSELKETLVNHFASQGKAPIRELDGYIADLNRIAHDDHFHSSAQCFSRYPEALQSQTPERTTMFLSEFVNRGILMPPLEGVTLDTTQLKVELQHTTDGSVQIKQLTNLLALNEKFNLNYNKEEIEERIQELRSQS